MADEYNNTSIAEGLGASATKLGGGGAFPDAQFDRLMSAVGVSVTNAPGVGVNAEGPKNDLSSLVLSQKGQTLGR